ncbi:MAG: NADP-dependent malic enzyme [Corynebacterium sp.]|uniref:NAD(P)-dependent malic enzyme n=1 Tax=Corynebacterium sp. TaxID=1720 RepID=UPI0026DAC96E|nr:NADP-dependent malic enzyme [Corynebacterium sp.]MDO5029550.1 NADP-dependent malic enzyme [Corynebacterium sp.]
MPAANSSAPTTATTQKANLHAVPENSSASSSNNSQPITDAEIFEAHKGGKLRSSSTMKLETIRDLSIGYTPGVARVCEAIHDDPALARTYTWTGQNVAVISDGTAVLGLGDIGPKAALPVMEGKAQLFEQFAGISAVPIVLDTLDTEEIIQTVKALAPSFGGVNLEDISAPRCFEIEQRLDQELDIPIFHDDQHGTAIVIAAGLINACKLTGRSMQDLRVVISGAGAAGVAATKMLLAAGVQDIIVVDSRGIIHPDREPLSDIKQWVARMTNPRGIKGEVADALDDANVFIGVSAGVVGEEKIARMAANPILFSLANPTPEIPMDVARKYGSVVATGRSDHPNQINNVLAFPGLFRGALEAGAKRITETMKLAATQAIANVGVDELSADRIIPSPLDPRVMPAVAKAVRDAALSDPASGAAEAMVIGETER